jgi:hypothetical protein
VMSGTPGAATVDMNTKNSRSTFYLSKMKTGIFTINVNAYIAPNIISQVSTTPNPQGGGFPSLGWGASPRSTGAGVETCPADTPTTAGVANPDYVTIPSGYHWVKVWLFRMTFSPRKYLKGANLANLGGLGCNPGKNSSNVVEFPDCAGLAALGDGSGLPPALISLGLGMCLTPTYDGSGNLTHLTPGGSDPTYSCSKQPVPWANPWSSTNTYGLDVCNGSGVATTTVPFDSAPTAEVYGNEDSAAPYEFLFVTTPPSVNTSDMSNSASPIYARYAPMRFRVDSDCGAADPSGCSTQYMLRNYGLKLHDVADAGDPPASDPSRAGVFPICALQPN